eukprot:13963387-Alexandrium_andersonii.AAC.1
MCIRDSQSAPPRVARGVASRQGPSSPSPALLLSPSRSLGTWPLSSSEEAAALPAPAADGLAS